MSRTKNNIDRRGMKVGNVMVESSHDFKEFSKRILKLQLEERKGLKKNFKLKFGNDRRPKNKTDTRSYKALIELRKQPRVTWNSRLLIKRTPV